MMSAVGKVKASTLVEALLAGVIFMTIFLISMNMATILMSIPDTRDRLEAEQLLGPSLECFKEEADPYCCREYSYDSCVIVIRGEPCSEHLRTVIMTAEIGGGRKISYSLLLPIDSLDDAR